MPKYPARTYEDIAKDKVDYSFLREKLKLKQFEAKKSFSEKYPHVEKFFAQKGVELGKIRQHSAKILGASALTGTLLLAPPTGLKGLPTPTELVDSLKALRDQSSVDLPQKFLVDLLKTVLPQNIRPLSHDEEKVLEQIFVKIIGIKAKGTLEGEHLNTTYGKIGAEQHLRRYPGDSMVNHGPYFEEGMAPGLGAWGYFAYSKDKLTPSLEETEKWYAVVQTLYLPDWERRHKYLVEWYKYRKVLIVNTDNGNAVVAAIADSGPAAWTGKHFGGSPEVMEYLGGPRYKKGPVLIFFVDDPENKVPLGPVEYNKQSLLLRSKINLPELALTQI